MGYVIDTSSLIRMWSEAYSPDVFATVWEKLEALIEDGHLCAPREVMNEVGPLSGDLKKWVKGQPGFIVNPNATINQLVGEILEGFPNLVDADAPRPQADPFVVALAHTRTFVVVAEEKPQRKSPRPRIPDVCAHYDIEYINALAMFRRLGWRF